MRWAGKSDLRKRKESYVGLDFNIFNGRPGGGGSGFCRSGRSGHGHSPDYFRDIPRFIFGIRDLSGGWAMTSTQFAMSSQAMGATS